MTLPTEDQITEEMKLEGFLSPLLDQYREAVTNAHPNWFDLSRRINRLSMKTWLGHSITSPNQEVNDPEPLAVRLFARAINSFEAAIILLERGMTVEGGNMARSVYETAFWLNYIHKAPKVAIKHFLLDELRGKEGRLKAHEKLYAEHPERLADIKRDLVKVRRQLRDQGKSPSIEQIATHGDVGHFFAYYKVLCGSSAHASVLSTGHYLNFFDNDEAGHTIGPDIDGTGRKLGFACHALILSLFGFAEIIRNEHTNNELLPLTKEFFELSEKFEFGSLD